MWPARVNSEILQGAKPGRRGIAVGRRIKAKRWIPESSSYGYVPISLMNYWRRRLVWRWDWDPMYVNMLTQTNLLVIILYQFRHVNSMHMTTLYKNLNPVNLCNTTQGHTYSHCSVNCQNMEFIYKNWPRWRDLHYADWIYSTQIF